MISPRHSNINPGELDNVLGDLLLTALKPAPLTLMALLESRHRLIVSKQGAAQRGAALEDDCCFVYDMFGPVCVCVRIIVCLSTE